MRAEIISVGTELLLGDIVNTNAQYLAQQLAGLGYSVFFQTVVGDNPARLRSLVLQAKERSDVLVFTGGLGPTEDDLTKEVVAEAFGDTLWQDPEEVEKLKALFTARGGTMPRGNLKQAMVPRFGRKLPNPQGTAPGAWFRQGSKYAVLLPGPPREMVPMFENEVLPLLEAMQDSVIRSVVLRVFGVGESALEDMVRELLDSPNPTAALYAKPGEVHIRITAKATTAQQADVMCDEYADLFRRILGDVVYAVGDEDLAATTVRLLLEKEATVATAESCTGGQLGEMITAVPGASGVYGFGAITYANEAKHQMLGVRNSTLRRYGAVSSQVAAEMAFGAAARSRDTYGIGITGIAGPEGGTPEKPVGLVYIALAKGRTVYVRKMERPGRDRAFVRQLACLNALDMLRRELLGLEIPGAKQFAKTQLADYERIGRPKRRGGPLGRALGALLLVAVLFALLLFGTGLGRRGQAAPPQSDSPSAQGHSYGTAAYTAAARAYVLKAKSENPAVAGFLAFPNQALEVLVAHSSTGSQDELPTATEEAGLAGLGVMAAAATTAQTAANTLVWGNGAFAPLATLLEEGAEQPTAFTYYTDSDVQEYCIFAMYLLEEAPADGFTPAVRALTGYQQFLSFAMGSGVRSLYQYPAGLEEGDSVMTLALPLPGDEGRSLYISGRLLRPGEEEAPTAAPLAAAAPLMPTGWYAQQGTAAPGTNALYQAALYTLLAGEMNNSELQLAAGVPHADALAMVAPPQPSPLPPTSSSSSSSSAESGDDDAGEDDATASNAEDAGTPLSEDAESTSGSDGSEDSTSASPSSSSSSAYVPPTSPARPPDAATLTVTLNGVVTTGATADILAQICQAEVPAAPEAAVQAVAVAAHSWIRNMQGAGVDAPAVRGAPASQKVQDAVGAVAHTLLSADGTAPALCTWYAMAALGTNSAQDVWGATRTYLVPATSPYDQDMPGWRQFITLGEEEFSALVQQGLGISLPAGDAARWLGEVEKNESGYVQTLTVGGRRVSGTRFWRALSAQGTLLLPSAAFETEYTGQGFSFLCYGAGHGVGMSLSGAAVYAREGWSFERILQHYYPGTALIQL